MCGLYQTQDGPAEMTPDDVERINNAVNTMAIKPLRVIAFAYFEMDLS